MKSRTTQNVGTIDFSVEFPGKATPLCHVQQRTLFEPSQAIFKDPP